LVERRAAGRHAVGGSPTALLRSRGHVGLRRSSSARDRVP
jgi:hypothetical protein